MWEKTAADYGHIKVIVRSELGGEGGIPRHIHTRVEDNRTGFIHYQSAQFADIGRAIRIAANSLTINCR